MDSLVARWKALSLPLKILTILGLPIVLAVLFVQMGSKISSMSNSKERKKTDEKDKKLNQEKIQLEEKISRSEGKLEQIESDKQQALKDAKNEDPTNFFNRHYPDDK